MTVAIGGSRRYNSFTDANATSIDTTAPVYPIRGSFDKFQCAAISTIYPNNGKNCTLYHEPKAEGKCFKATFGDWYCNMDDLNNNESDREYNLPPPGGAGAVETSDKNQPAASNDQQSETLAAMDDNTDENGFIKPDFSEMQKYFDVTKYEYDMTDRQLTFVAKMTKKNNPNDWVIDFYDADGVKLIDTNGISIRGGDYAKPGDVARYYFTCRPNR